MRKLTKKLMYLAAITAITAIMCTLCACTSPESGKPDPTPGDETRLTYEDGTYYEGAIENGIAHGSGKLYSKDGALIYEGDFVSGKREGQGVMYYADGLTFTGEWERDNRLRGKLQLSDKGEYYDGEFLFDDIYGQGTLCTMGTNSIEGDISTYNLYVGAVDGLKKHGEGVFTANGEDKTVYAGKFVNDALSDENAVITYPEDSELLKYEGGYFNGAFNGYGVLTYRNGDVKEGSWKDGECSTNYVSDMDYNGWKYTGFVDENGIPDGEGTIVFPDGSVRTGTFVDGAMNGKGKHTYPNTMTYEGEFKDNLFHGYGVFNWNRYDEFGGLIEAGWRYEGEFANGSPAGCVGTVYFNQAETGDGVYYFKGEMSGFPEVKRDQIGEGKIVYRDGTYYIGQIKYDANGNWSRVGKGTMYFLNSLEGNLVGVQDGSSLTYYVGEFDESKSGWMFGNGVFYLSNYGAPSGYITGYWGGTARLGEYFDEKNPWSTDMLLEKWKHTKEYEYRNRVNPPASYKDVDVLFVGDSYFDFWRDSRGGDTGGSYETDTKGINCENVGIGGTRFDQWIDYFDVLIKGYNPEKVVIHLGVNDLNVGKSKEKTLDDMKKLTALIHEQLPEALVYVVTYEPSAAFVNRWNEVGKDYNAALKNYAVGVDYLTVIDTATEFTDPATGGVKSGYNSSDGLHLSNGLGYPAFWSVIKKAIGY